MLKTIVVCSGGLDSVTLAYKVFHERSLAGLISFNYGQRHKKELDFAADCADRLKVKHTVIDITGIGSQLSGSALTDKIDVPDGHYEEETMKVTVVPNRNAILLAIAYGVASSQGADSIAAAFHGGDHFIYPDCRPEFVDAFQKMQNFALKGISDISLYTPFVHISKSEIVKQGAFLKVPFELTWSCYKGGEIHCGRCGTCVERREAFCIADIPDPTSYFDPNYWMDAVSRAKKEKSL